MNTEKKAPKLPPPIVIRVGMALRARFFAWMTRVIPPQLTIFDNATAMMRSSALHICAKLRLADKLAAGPKSGIELAYECNANADALERVMRAMVSIGIFQQVRDGRYANNAVSNLLISNAPGNWCAFAEYFGAPYHMRAWASFEHTVRSGKSAFEHVYDMTFWEYCAKHPEESNVWVSAMAAGTEIEAPGLATTYPFSEIKKLCDVAGGTGTLISTILAHHPQLNAVLFDESHVLEHAAVLLEKRGVASRCEVVRGNFFESIPSGCDAYLLKDILHDWDDEHSIRILSNCRRAMERGARLLIVELVVIDPKDSFVTFSDLQMMTVCTGGRQRSEFEFRSLFERAGFRLQRVLPLPAFASVVEGIAI